MQGGASATVLCGHIAGSAWDGAMATGGHFRSHISGGVLSLTNVVVKDSGRSGIAAVHGGFCTAHGCRVVNSGDESYQDQASSVGEHGAYPHSRARGTIERTQGMLQAATHEM